MGITQDKMVKYILRLGGFGMIVLPLFFLMTGFEEIVSDGGFWLFGAGIAGFVFTAGLISINLSCSSQSDKVLAGLLILLCLFMAFSIFGFVR